MGPLLLKLYATRLGEAGAPLVSRADAQIAGILDYMEGALGSSAFFTGPELTAADVQISFPLEVATDRGGLGPSRPNLWSFLERIHRRPAYRRALERGGPYRFVKQVPS